MDHFKDLNRLLSEAIRQASQRIKDEAKRQYQDPTQWHKGKTVELIYTDPSGSLSSLGVFQEHLYRPRWARKLVPLHPAPEEADLVEFVYGRHWIEQCPSAAQEESPAELDRLRKRFDELMQEVTDGL